MKKKLIATFSFLAVVVILLLLTACSSETAEEKKKTYTISVFSGGGIAKEYKGIKLKYTAFGYVKFIDEDGKDLIILGGPTLIEED